jgi:hypothetical protein
MRHIRRDVQHFAFPKRHLIAIHEQLQGSLEHVRHLLAVVRVLRNNRTALQVNLGNGLPFSRHEFSGNHLRNLFEREFVPAVETIGSVQGVIQGADYSIRTDV